MSYIDTQNNLHAIGSDLKQYLFIFFIFFGVVKSDKGAELITFHILNIFIYFSRMVIGPGKEKLYIIDNNFLMYFPHFIFFSVFKCDEK